MKVFIASDLHGSAEYCRLMLQAFEKENADKLLLLGDILYHGPRNDLPKDYNPKEVIKLLGEVKEKAICVSGNCDAQIDRELLPFVVLSDLGAIFVDGLNIYFAHGHNATPPLREGDVYLSGHTHVQVNEVVGGYYHLNPGSLSLPKENSKRGYIVYETHRFTFKDLNGEVFDSLDLNKAEINAADENEQTTIEIQVPIDKLDDEIIDEIVKIADEVKTPEKREPAHASVKSAQVVRKKIFIRRK